MRDDMEERRSIHDTSDRYLASVALAGNAVIAVKSGMGISDIGIESTQAADENPYRTFCTPRRFRGSGSSLRYLIAGEAAQVAVGLKSFDEIDLLGQHSHAAQVVRKWKSYWHPYPHFYSLREDWSDEIEEETKLLLGLVRWQVRRRLRYEPERSAVEALALKIRDGKALSGAEAEKFIRRYCRSHER